MGQPCRRADRTPEPCRDGAASACRGRAGAATRGGTRGPLPFPPDPAAPRVGSAGLRSDAGTSASAASGTVSSPPSRRSIAARRLARISHWFITRFRRSGITTSRAALYCCQGDEPSTNCGNDNRSPCQATSLSTAFAACQEWPQIVDRREERRCRDRSRAGNGRRSRKRSPSPVPQTSDR